MSIKLVDTLEPMADFPIAMAENIGFADGKTLQEKYDSGELVSSAEAPVKVTDGKISLDTVPITKGGTGVTTQEDINKAFINNLEIDNSDVTDGTEFVSSWSSDKGFAETAEGALNKPYKRQFIKVWNYIKDKISSVLGLTSAKVLSYDSHLSNKDNPHSVTKSQVGLDSVVNTGDSATPVSGGTTKFTTGGAYTELNKKVDKVDGKGLSSNDFTNTYKNKLDNIDTTVTTNSSNLVTSGAVATAISTEVTNRNTAITNAINNLDVSSVGGDGKYISAISETNGKISATSTTMDTAPTTNSVKAVTSGGIKTAISTAETNAKNLANATGTLPVANGGTGAITAKGAQKSLLSDMQTETTEMDDTTEFVMKYGTPTDTKGALFKRSATLVWNYIKGKISSVLGLTATAYGGNANTATTAESANKIVPNYTKSLDLKTVTSATTKYIKVANCTQSQTGTLQVHLAGNAFEDTLVINFGNSKGSKPMLCGYYSGSDQKVLSVIAKNEFNYSIYVKVTQITTLNVKVTLLKGDCTINITESTTAPTNISEWNVSDGLFGTLIGNVTGNVSGSSGSCTGTSASAKYAKRADYPTGFDSMTSNGNWGDRKGSLMTAWTKGDTEQICFRYNAPTDGNVSMYLTGQVYVVNGNYPVGPMSKDKNGYWGMVTPEGNIGGYIRTTINGIIPYKEATAAEATSSLGTSYWYFSSVYAREHYGTKANYTSSVTIGDGVITYNTSTKSFDFTFS